MGKFFFNKLIGLATLCTPKLQMLIYVSCAGLFVKTVV